MKKSAVAPFLGLIGLVLAVACGSSNPSAGQKVATQECVECHANLITCTKLGRDAAYWGKTVQRMVDKGMDLSEKEQRAVIDYLAGLESGASPVCD